MVACCCRYCCIWKQPRWVYCLVESYIFIKHCALKPGVFLVDVIFKYLTFMEVKGMHTTRLKRVGGSVMLTVPPAPGLLSLGTDNEVGMVIDNGRLIVEPYRRPQ